MGILNKDLFTEDELNSSKTRFNLLIYYFNKVAEEYPDKVDQMTYIEFHKYSKEQLKVEEWIEFFSDYRVSMLLDKLMLINMRSNINRLINSEDKSVAGSQKLNAALNFLGKYFEDAMNRDSVKYIYTSVPLTPAEEKSRDARTLLIKPKVNPHNPAVPGTSTGKAVNG
jgi:hypothetical protein